jgi:hypothetical protein
VPEGKVHLPSNEDPVPKLIRPLAVRYLANEVYRVIAVNEPLEADMRRTGYTRCLIRRPAAHLDSQFMICGSQNERCVEEEVKAKNRRHNYEVTDEKSAAT